MTTATATTATTSAAPRTLPVPAATPLCACLAGLLARAARRRPAAFAGACAVDRDRERLLADLRALPDARRG